MPGFELSILKEINESLKIIARKMSERKDKCPNCGSSSCGRKKTTYPGLDRIFCYQCEKTTFVDT